MMAVSQQPQQDRQPSYRYATDKPLELEAGAVTDPKTLEYREPCNQPKGKDESELCAQWRAAKAAEAGAFWAKWSFWIGLFGISGLIWTIRQGHVALDKAREANEISRESLSLQLRPWISSLGAGIRLVEDQHFEGDGSHSEYGLVFSQKWKNTGQSPATSVVVSAEFFAQIREAPLPVFDHTGAAGEKATIAAGGEFGTGEMGVGKELTDLWIARQIDIFLHSRVSYQDSLMPRRSYWTECTLRISFNGWNEKEGVKYPNTWIRTEGPQNDLI